jgi:hypothetical protein
MLSRTQFAVNRRGMLGLKIAALLRSTTPVAPTLRTGLETIALAVIPPCFPVPSAPLEELAAAGGDASSSGG